MKYSTSFRGHKVQITVEYDAEVNRYFTSDSNIPGLCMEGDSPEELYDLIPEFLDGMI